MSLESATSLLMDARVRHSAQAEQVDSGHDAPIRRTELPDGAPFWLVTGYAEAERALAAPQLCNSLAAATPGWQRRCELFPASAPVIAQGDGFGRNMLVSDPPDHARLKRTAARGLTPVMNSHVVARLQRIADRLVDSFAADGTAELAADFMAPLTVTAICELLGLDQQITVQWLGLHHFQPPPLLEPPGSPVRDAFGRQRLAQLSFCDEIIADKRRHPGDDLLTRLIAASDGGQLSPAELAATIYLLLTAGSEAPVRFLALALPALWRQPALAAALRADPALLPAVTEDLLRYTSPLAVSLPRFHPEPARLCGVTIPPGEPVAVHLAVANRDPRRFRDPHRIDPARPDPGNLAFGHGAHFCAGAALGRLECQVALGTLLRRLPDLVPAVPLEQIGWLNGCTSAILTHLPVIAGPERLPVTFTPVPPTSSR